MEYFKVTFHESATELVHFLLLDRRGPKEVQTYQVTHFQPKQPKRVLTN